MSVTGARIHLVAYAVAVAGLLALGNVVAAQKHLRWDLTAQGRHTLSAQTLKVLKALPDDVTVTAFVKDLPTDRLHPRQLLEQYAYRSDRFAWTFVDPDADPATARKYGVTRFNTFAVGEPERMEKISGYLTEERLTNALIRASVTERKAVYFTAGHGEKNLSNGGAEGYADAASWLAQENYLVKELLLYGVEAVPEDAAAVVLAGPQKDLEEGELERLRTYLDGGGKVLLMVEPLRLRDTLRLAERYGIRLRDDVVVDKVSRILGGDTLSPAVNDYEQHPITEGFGLMTLFPTVRSIDVDPNPRAGVFTQVLARTLPPTWGETDLKRLGDEGTTAFDAGRDTEGPLVISAVAERAIPRENGEGTTGVLVVVGDADFASNGYLRRAGNGDFFMNIVNWLTEEEDRIAIRPRPASVDPLVFTEPQIVLIAGLTVLGLPGAVLAVGIWIRIRRRRP